MEEENNQRILSGVQPTGKLHVGNYLGMLKNAVELQDKSDDCLYSIVDLHSLTGNFEPNEKREQIVDLALDLLAGGIDPEKSILFKQSDILEHANLAWIFNTITYIGELERMTQYKDKSQNQPDNLNVGLFDYPVLMAADILLYKAEGVPVGDDQTQHIELARDIAKRFNNRFGDTFPIPKGLYTEAPRVMSILAPEKKMSKSLGDNHCIYLTDDPDVIKKKLAKAVTATDADSEEMPAGVANLFTLLKHFGSEAEYAKFEHKYTEKNISYKELKEELADIIAKYFQPFREKRAKLKKHPEKIEAILTSGAKKAKKIASSVYDEVREKIGIN